MTTQLTTSNLQGSPTGPEVTGVNPPANFPDESTIARLANEFFQQCQAQAVRLLHRALTWTYLSERHLTHRNRVNHFLHSVVVRPISPFRKVSIRNILSIFQICQTTLNVEL